MVFAGASLIWYPSTRENKKKYDRFRKYSRDQRSLLPLSKRDWLPEGHPAWFIIDSVKETNLDAFDERYSEDGVGDLRGFSPGKDVEEPS
jgi:hypothetical protein